MKAALPGGLGAAFKRGGMSHSLHYLAFIRVVCRRPANIFANVERHGFDFPRVLPLVPGMYEPAGKACYIKMCVGG
ncbi:hypothetical protein EV132_12117 [Rhizobium sullae]|uniref:Uncharacterized protein n=1 Tax=Rhizobium sullae TaxID=50338 RepID=A0A4R3PU89_RHISU|nr:hypothetical protein EV132_12117 [Rhizobium sullae]